MCGSLYAADRFSCRDEVGVVGEDDREFAETGRHVLDSCERELNIDSLLHWRFGRIVRIAQRAQARNDEVFVLAHPRSGMPSVRAIADGILRRVRKAAMNLNANELPVVATTITRRESFRKPIRAELSLFAR